MDSYNKTFAKFRLFKKNCRKVNFNELPLNKTNKIRNFRYLTHYREWDKQTNDKSWYCNSKSISPWTRTCPVPKAAVWHGQSGQNQRWPGHRTSPWHLVRAWEDPNQKRTWMGPGLVSSCGGWRTGCPQSAPLLPGPWGWCPWTEPETLTAASQLTGGPEGPL